MIKTIEFITDKGISNLNEDNYILDENLFMVFDGATSLTKYTKNGKTGGYIASNIARQTFLNSKKLNMETLKQANLNIKKEMLKNNIDINKPEQRWSTIFSGIQINENTITLMQIGDCSIYLKEKNKHLNRITKDQLDPFDSKVIDLATKLRFSQKFSREELLPLLIQNRAMANKPDGYAVLNGTEIPENLIFFKKIQKNNIEYIILTTDGFNSLEHKSKQNSFESLFPKYNSLSETLKFIRDQEEKDKECLNFPRIKQHDDATAILIKFE